MIEEGGDERKLEKKHIGRDPEIAVDGQACF